jgi:hypothetical protein
MVTQESHTLFVFGIVMLLAGPIIMFCGERRKPVRGGVVLSIFAGRSGSSNRVRFGAGLLFAGVLVLLKALDAV